MSLVNTGDVAGAAEYSRLELKANPNDYLANLQLGALLRPERYQLAVENIGEGRVEQSAKELEGLIAEAHVTLTSVYSCLKRKADSDRERAIFQRLDSDAQAKQPGVKQEPAPK